MMSGSGSCRDQYDSILDNQQATEIQDSPIELLRERNERIRQLEKQCATLAAEIDRMRPVVEAAIKWNETNYRDMKECELALDAIGNTCDDYQARKLK